MNLEDLFHKNSFVVDYTNVIPEKEQLFSLIEAARFAFSYNNQQLLRYMIVTDEELIFQMSHFS